MSMDTANYIEKFEFEVGGRKYVFHQVPLEKSPIGKWAISYKMMRKMMMAISARILSDLDEALTFSELQHLAETAEMSMAKVAEMVKLDRSTITKWKNADIDIPYVVSYCLKDKLSKLIFEQPEAQSDTVQKRFSFWMLKGELPQLEVAS